MFSRREREFLTLLATDPPVRAAARVLERFPSAGYRRRLFWGIRRKVARVAGDLDLYARAATSEARVVRPSATPMETPVPAYNEPLAALVERVAARLRRPSPDRTETGTRG